MVWRTHVCEEHKQSSTHCQRPDCVEVLWNNLYTKLYNEKEMLGAAVPAAPWGTGVQLKEGVSAD